MQNKNVLIVIAVVVAVAIALVLLYANKTTLFKGYIGIGGSTGQQAPNTNCPSTSPCIVPSDAISRGEFVAIVSRAISRLPQKGLSESKDCFVDTVGYKYENYICYAVSKGWIAGGPYFNPNNFVTRAEAAKYIINAFELDIYQTIQQLAYDVPIEVWYYDYVNTVVKNKIAKLQSIDKKRWFFPGAQLSKTDAKDWVKKAKAL